MPRFLFASDSLKGTLSSAQTAELLAAAAGLPLVAPAERDVTIALGGSATNDGGMGCMRALGFRLLGAGREELAGRGGDLALVRAIDRSHADARLGRTSFTVMCDVDNPLLGPNGATRTFAPQKGEGRLDAQTADGKVAAGIAAACARAGVPCVAVVGSVEPGAVPPAGVTAVFPTACGPMTLDFALAHDTELYAQTAERPFSALAAGARLGASR